MTIELKTFQKNTLAVLAKYLEQARLTDDPQAAFLAVARDPHGRVPIYRRVPGLEDCALRLPAAAHRRRQDDRRGARHPHGGAQLHREGIPGRPLAGAHQHHPHPDRGRAQKPDPLLPPGARRRVRGPRRRFRHRRHRQHPARRPERPRLRHRRHHPDPPRRKDRGPRRLRGQRGAGKPLHPAEHDAARPGAVRRRPERRRPACGLGQILLRQPADDPPAAGDRGRGAQRAHRPHLRRAQAGGAVVHHRADRHARHRSPHRQQHSPPRLRVGAQGRGADQAAHRAHRASDRLAGRGARRAADPRPPGRAGRARAGLHPARCC